MLKVEVTRRAALQIESAAVWWAQNRPAAPDAIHLDFREATILLSQQPGAGAKSSTPRYPNLRRLYLTRVGYHIYYRSEPGKVVILAFWHSSRGRGPRL